MAVVVLLCARTSQLAGINTQKRRDDEILMRRQRARAVMGHVDGNERTDTMR